METLDDVLAHYGIKGMKWGVRRSRAQLDRAAGRVRKGGPPSSDAQKARESLKKAKKGGVKTLTNDELQQLNNRLNLEQNYSRLTGQKSRLQKGQDFIKKVVGVGNTVNEAVKFANSPVGQQIASQVGMKKKSK